MIKIGHYIMSDFFISIKIGYFNISTSHSRLFINQIYNYAEKNIIIGSYYDYTLDEF